MKHITVLLHNIRSVYNIGSMFRTSECAGIEKIILSGYTATPPRKDLAKVSLGAENTVPWEQTGNYIETVAQLKKEGYLIASLEITSKAIDIRNFPKDQNKICLIVGNEVTGVEQDILQISDLHVSLPMFGKKESLNVSNAFAVAVYQLIL